MNVLPTPHNEQISNDAISAMVGKYLVRHPDQADRLKLFTDTLASVGELTDRKTLPGHVTTGAFVLDGENRMLQIAHKSLRCWLNPGGHTEPTDASTLNAVLRELHEETGIGPESVELLGDPDLPLTIDVHPIPANPDKGEPEHLHFDFRYAFRFVGDPHAIELQLDEVDDHRWIPFEQADLGPDTERLAAVAGQSQGFGSA